MEEDERRRSVVEGTAASSSGEGAGGAPPKSGCPHAHLKALPLRGTCNFVSILLSTGAILRLAKVRISSQSQSASAPSVPTPHVAPKFDLRPCSQGPTDLKEVVSAAGLLAAASIACGVANSGLLPAASDSSTPSSADSLLASPCAAARRSLATTTFAGACLVPGTNWNGDVELTPGFSSRRDWCGNGRGCWLVSSSAQRFGRLVTNVRKLGK
jgi:hypothetical protein